MVVLVVKPCGGAGVAAGSHWQITTMYVADNRKDYKAKLVELLLKSVDGARESTYGSVSINLAPFCTPHPIMSTYPCLSLTNATSIPRAVHV
jgi:hypothetical protein